MDEVDYTGATILDENDDTGETLYQITTAYGDRISVIVDDGGQEYFNDDWQGPQPRNFEEIAQGGWRWYTGEQIDF